MAEINVQKLGIFMVGHLDSVRDIVEINSYQKLILIMMY